MILDFSKCKLQPYAHQRRGVEAMIAKPRYGLFWEMRLGKTKAVIDAACFLKDAGELDAVVIACPAQVKDVWGHKQLGEIRKHAFVPWSYVPLDGKTRDYADILAQSAEGLLFMTVSHELLRQEDATGDFPAIADIRRSLEGKRVWLVYDETAAFGNHKSLQTKSAMWLGKRIEPARRTLLDGTPIGNHPVEQYSKFGLLGKDVLGFDNFFHFRAVHQVAQPHSFAAKGKQYVGFQKQELIDRKVRPFCEYLEQRDCLDMPKKVPGFLTAALSPKAWRAYKDFRDEMVAELDAGVLTTQHAAVKAMRLAQICAGFAGGVETPEGLVQTVEVGDESCKAVMDWLERMYAQDVGFKTVVWCRWRPEIERLHARLEKNKRFFTKPAIVYSGRTTYGGELHPDHEYSGPMVVVAQQQALKYGVNMSKATAELFASQDYNRVTRAQAEERIQPGEGIRATSMVMDLLVTGPAGQRTIVWDIKESVQSKDEVARRTAGEWKKVLLEE